MKKNTDRESIAVSDFYGLVLGSGRYSVDFRFAEKAIDVDLSYGGIKSFKCDQPVCGIDIGVAGIGHVGACCRDGSFYHADHCDGSMMIEGGILRVGDVCSAECRLGMPAPPTPSVGSASCSCGALNKVVRTAYTYKGLIGPLSPPSRVGSSGSVQLPSLPDGYCIDGVAVFMSAGGHSPASSDPSHLGFVGHGTSGSVSICSGAGFPPYSEGWASPPVGARFLVRHGSGAYMCSTGKVLNISHKWASHLWGKYNLSFPSDIVTVKESKGRVLVFCGDVVYIIIEGRKGFDAQIIDVDVCVKSDKSVVSTNDAVFYMSDGGIKQIGISNLSGARSASSDGFIDEEIMNPSYMRTINQNWRIGYYNGRIHFANDDNAYIYDTTKRGQKSALVESSVIPECYYTNCDGLYYRVRDVIYVWNPVGGECCDYIYRTRPIVYDSCVNIGAMRTLGECDCDGSSKATFINVDCCDEKVICECDVNLCGSQHITGCQNIRQMAIEFTGNAHIQEYELSRSPRDIK